MEKIAPMLADAEFQFEFKEPASLPNPMLAIRDAVFGYRAESAIKDGAGDAVSASANVPFDAKPELSDYATTATLHAQLAARGELPPEPQPGDRIILRGVSRTVLAGQRIGILGANGQGKSTLVKTIARTLPLLGGQVTEGKGLAIGYFAQQELDVLHPGSTPLEHMVRLARETGRAHTDDAREQQLRNFLGSFSFPGEMVMQPVGQFSGGEKARLVLAMIVWQRPNLLLLDEPTNHLDLATREALAVALNEFEGTLMLVSHDRALLRSVCDEFWLVGRGGVAPFEGDLDDYQRYLLDEAKRLREQAAGQNATDSVAACADPASATAPKDLQLAAKPAEQRRLDAQRRQQLAEKIKPLRRALQQTDQRMRTLTGERDALEQRLATPLPPPDIADAGRRLKTVGDELAALEDEWLRLSGEIEAIEQAAAPA
ncbi:ATP-binding cassette domain-containing protein [Ottowia testudinis]|uniref:ATP-binding cassette domain-containing protein n=2 Tax=Ottowia testudinis TaxID=2816950 RepID=A0A975H4Y0_9BURK|nr:ATP-binding cassette domain-containing protein [Ottowia testudinis]